MLANHAIKDYKENKEKIVQEVGRQAEDDLWSEIIYYLTGTCSNLDTVLENVFNRPDLLDHMPFLQYLDGEIFLCEACSWWWELSEEAGLEEHELTCRGCAEDAGEELD